jgi:hypothetical protein
MVTNGNEKGSKISSAVGNLLKSPAIFCDHNFSQCGQEQNVISWEIDYFIKNHQKRPKTPLFNDFLGVFQESYKKFLEKVPSTFLPWTYFWHVQNSIPENSFPKKNFKNGVLA